MPQEGYGGSSSPPQAGGTPTATSPGVQASGTHQRQGRPCRSRVPPAGTFPRKSRPGDGVPGLAGWGGVARLAAGGRWGTPTAPAHGERTAGLPGQGKAALGVARLSGDGAIRRYGGRRSQTGRILTRFPLSGATERRSGAAFHTRRRSHRHPPNSRSPPKGHLRERADVPSPSRGSQPGWGWGG